MCVYIYVYTYAQTYIHGGRGGRGVAPNPSLGVSGTLALRPAHFKATPTQMKKLLRYSHAKDTPLVTLGS